MVSSEELKTFGYQITFIFSVVIGLILPWGWNYKISLIPFILGGVTILLRFIFLRGLIYFYYPWQFIFNVLTYIKAKILLSLSYFFLISPIGIFMRLIGKDPMSKKFDNDETSYLKRSEDEKFDPTSLKYPF
ncbi:SxtJ family membrane protein [Halobacteriovorax sp.]|uniref:SxtJ family membrane protein n=1 Tax=Halobacteriovorax sp. TaxID=2020862 RepID=UPI00356319D0